MSRPATTLTTKKGGSPTEADDLARLLTDRGAAVGREPDGALRVTGATADEIGDLARARGLGLLELSPQRMSLEQRYMELTRDAADYRSGDSAPTLSAK